MNVSEGKEKSLEEEEVKATPSTEKKEKEGERKNKGGGGGEKEDSDERSDGDKDADGNDDDHQIPKLSELWAFLENHPNHKNIAGVLKNVNLLNTPPTWNEEERKKTEKESLTKLLLSMRVEIIKLVRNHEQKYTVTIDYNEKKIICQLSLLDFVDGFRAKAETYEGGRMSPLLVEQCECLLTFLIECRSHVDVDCVINEIDDAFGSSDMMKLFLCLVEELVNWQKLEDDPIVKFSEASLVDLIKTLKFMKVFEDTRDKNVRGYCCILMFFMLTTDVYVENMRRASWVQALLKKRYYLESRVLLEKEGKISMRKFVKESIESELTLVQAILKDDRLRVDNELFDEIANVFGFVFNTGKVFHLMSKVFDEVYGVKYDENKKLKFLTDLLGKASVKCMDKANEKALAGKIDKKSTSCEIKRDANVVVITPLQRFKTFISEEKDEEMQYFWRFVLCTVGLRETFLSDQLLFDMTFCCRDLRVKKKEISAGTNAEERRKIKQLERKTDRMEDTWLKNAKNFYNLGHVNASIPPASDRAGRPVAFHLVNSVLSYVFSGTTNGGGGRKMKVKMEDEENIEKKKAKVPGDEEDELDVGEDDEEVEFLCEVIIIEDDEKEEEKQEQQQEEEKQEDREKKEERNEMCQEVARTLRYYYLIMFFPPQSKEKSDSTCVAHAMHGMRLIGILRLAIGETCQWGKGTKKGEQNMDVLVEFMKSMLDQMSNYYARIQAKLEGMKKRG
jgi:hypothetical protein